jgi:DNA-binding CsgD family transcriptional regulator
VCKTRHSDARRCKPLATAQRDEHEYGQTANGARLKQLIMRASATLATEGELEERRREVVRLRARRMSELQIARALGVSASTVSRDLGWVRSNWQEMFGPNPHFDVAVFIGESLALFAEIEATALLDSEQPDIGVRNRMACYRTAMQARERSVALIQD